MEVEIKIDDSCKEPKIIIYTSSVSKDILDLAARLSNDNLKLILGFNKDEIFIINPDEIISIYTENQKVFARCDKGIYRLRNRLYELEENLPGPSFIRISNSEIVNFNKVSSLDMSISGTINVKFINGQKTFVSRRYMEKIKKYLGI